MTIIKLIELLQIYKDAVITNEQNEDFIHIINQRDGSVILSTVKPIGTCNRTNSYVYPSKIKGYSAFCPELDEDLYNMEWTPKLKVTKHKEK